MAEKQFAMGGLIILLSTLTACRFMGGGKGDAIRSDDPPPDTPKTAATQVPTELGGGFITPAYDIANLSPLVYPPTADDYSDCLQGPEPDWSAPSARLFDWRDPYALPNRLLCIYGIPAPPDGWSFTIELTDPAENVYVESFTTEGELLITASGEKHWYLPSAYEGVPYIGLPLFFGDPQGEGDWQVSAYSLDGTLVLDSTSLSVEGISGIFILSAPPGNPFDVFPLEEASGWQTAYIYLVGGQPHSEYVVALYTIDPNMARDFGLQPGEPAPNEILAISTLVPQYATVLNSDQNGIAETQFNIDESIPAGQYFVVAFPGVHGSLSISLTPMIVARE